MNCLKLSNSYRLRHYPINILLGLLVALVIADGVISNFLIAHGFAREGNPLLQNWVNKEGFMVIKVAGALLAALALWDIYKRNPRLSFISTTCFVAVYSLIVGWNLAIFFFNQF